MNRFWRGWRPRGRFILFVLLSLFIVAQVSWWMIYQNRTGARIETLQQQIWRQQIATAHQWTSQHEELPADSLARWVGVMFPDLEYHPARDSLAITAAARERLAEETTHVTRMFAMESAFFVVIILAGMVYMYLTLRHEVRVERQYANFLSAVTHELRSPVAAIKLLHETLSAGELPPDKRAKVLHSIRRSLDRLHLLIDRLLKTREFSARGKRVLNLRRVDLADVSGAALRELTGGHPEARERVRVSFMRPLPVVIDPEHWRILVTNLVENALKYSEEPVEVELAGDGRFARLSVRDRGIGFARRERRRVFRRFYRVGNEDTRRSEGSGLGLYLVREIARSFRGRVRADSPGPDRGATFTVRVPLAKGDGDETADPRG